MMNEKEFLEKVGLNVRVERTKKGLSQEELAGFIESNQRYISLIEKGDQNTTLSLLFKISEALKTEPYKFLKFDE